MAPIVATGSGIVPQTLEDPELRHLLDILHQLPLSISEISNVERLSLLLDPWKEEWLFEEQVDLHCWIHPLNVMDAALTWILKEYSKNMLLIPAVSCTHIASHDCEAAAFEACSNACQVEQCPVEVMRYCSTILQFSAALLRNAISKNLYASVPIVADMLAVADDDIADHALSVLTALSLPPALHKQQRPDHQLHTTQLHQASSSPFASVTIPSNSSTNIYQTDVHDRLLATARGWGTRAMGLGLFAAIVADDSIYGQGSLPSDVGTLQFSFFKSEEKLVDGNVVNETTLKEISLSLSEMLVEPPADCEKSSPEMSASIVEGVDIIERAASKKRRRVTASFSSQKVKSTAEVFFLALKQVEGIHNIPSDRRFSLLADIRLARSFHSQSSRCAAVSRRLCALIAILNSHPSQEIMSGYFQAQPEISVEIVDLLNPLVSAANVSTACSNPLKSANDAERASKFRQDLITNLAGCSTIPFDLRMLAVEALTAIVSRRDGATGILSSTPRSPSVLTELGVGRGQYLGLLPTLIRYSLASLNTTNDSTKKDADIFTASIENALDIGLDFVEASMTTTVPRNILAERALRFTDNVLTLTLAVIGTPSGTSSLVDCGLVPALLSTVSSDPNTTLEVLLLESMPSCNATEIRRLRALLRFVTGQAVQILEGAIVTHNNALNAFFDMNGVDIIIERLSKEMTSFRLDPSVTIRDTIVDDPDGDTRMDSTSAFDCDRPESFPSLLSSQRVFLYSILTCLTVVFHQESSNSGTPSGGAHLRKKELADAILEILTNVPVYGGHVAALVATLLSDTMNNDPQVVRFVHDSGIAGSFLTMLIGKHESSEPVLPPVPELIMAIPNVIAALALTEEGAKAVAKVNPFPSMLRLLHHRDYAMPKSRCLLNEMTSIIGTGLDEIMRHIEILKNPVLSAIVRAMNLVIKEADELELREEALCRFGMPSEEQIRFLDDHRSSLIQYVLNFGQLLEQILHNKDHCEPFVDAGGLDALLRLFPISLPSAVQFLPYISSLSAPSVSTLHHSTTEETLGVAMKCIEFRYNPLKLLQKLENVANDFLTELSEIESHLHRDQGDFCLDTIPQESLYKAEKCVARNELLFYSKYLRCTVNIHWITSLLANAIKAACQRGGESGLTGERDWRKEISSENFQDIFVRLSKFHWVSLFEVCRVRAEDKFEVLERNRLTTRTKGIRYRLRIVCPEGAVVRNGIEIDSCANMGNMEMGDIVESFDRCVNSSGILRYRTDRGWVSEMTRGHGREPIAEVIGLWEDNTTVVDDDNEINRREAGICDLRSAAVGVLAKVQTGFSELYAALSKTVIQSVRSLPLSSAFANNDAGHRTAVIIKILCRCVVDGLWHDRVSETATCVLAGKPCSDLHTSSAGAAMYLGCLLHLFHVGVFDEKQERRMVNFPLLVALVASDEFVYAVSRECRGQRNVAHRKRSDQSLNLFDAIRFIFRHGLIDFTRRCGQEPLAGHQIVSRSVAASFPPLLSLLRKMINTQMSSSPAASIMRRMTWMDVARLISKDYMSFEWASEPVPDTFFQPESFVADLHLSLSKTVKEVWVDDRLLYAPSFLLHPITIITRDLLTVLESMTKNNTSRTALSSAKQPTDLSPQQQYDEEHTESVLDEDFEPSEESIRRMTEMGFNRVRAINALQRVRSNLVEVAMEYALNNASDHAAVERRPFDQNLQAHLRTEHDGSEAGADVDTADESVPSQPASAPADMQSDDVSNGGDHVGVNHSAGKELKESEKSRVIAVRNSFLQVEFTTWIETMPEVVCSLLDHLPFPSQNIQEKAEMPEGDGEAEAVTVILSSFLLDLCRRKQSERHVIAGKVFTQLKSKLKRINDESITSWFIPDNSSAGVAALCHAAVLIIRALPKMRLLVLKEGLVVPLISSIESCISPKSRKKGTLKASSLPLWLTPVLLLLEIMAQPLVAFSGDPMIQAIMEDSPDQEFYQVKKEHEEQESCLLLAAKNCLVAHSVSSSQGGLNSNMPKDQNGSMKEGDRDKVDLDATIPLFSIPAYSPLLPSHALHSCLEICHCLLHEDSDETYIGFLPPGVTQSTLLLLLRILRSPSAASRCLQMGVADDILALPHKCYFSGNTGLVSLIFRRLLEDESTVHAMMEAEIRGIFLKLNGKKNQEDLEGKDIIALAPFIQTSTSLICRNPISFLRALSHCVRFDVKSASETNVVLLSPAERLHRLQDVTGGDKNYILKAVGRTETKEEDSLSNIAKVKSKARRASYPKKGKKDLSENVRFSFAETPATHISSLLIASVITTTTTNGSSGRDIDFFLSPGDLLEVLADLILAVPTFASAVHNHRPHRMKDKSKRLSSGGQIPHALHNCPPPPKTFVTFLLHVLIPQDRWTIRNDVQIWIRESDSTEKMSLQVKTKKKRAYIIAKVAQNAARVIAALLVRPGEGRKRVIADLVFAMSGGNFGHGATPSPCLSKAIESFASELHAIFAWGELCLGLMSLRSNRKNLELLSSLSVEILWLMLDQGMVHAILYAMNRVGFSHPMISSVYRVLLVSLEILTRTNVTDSVKTLAENEHHSKLKFQSKPLALKADCDSGVQLDALVYQENSSALAVSADYNALVLAADSDMDEAGSRNIDEEMDDGEESEGEEGRSSDGSVDETSEDESDDADMEEDDGPDEEESDEEVSTSDEVEEEEVWDVEYDNNFDAGGAMGERQDFEVEEDGTDRVEDEEDGGWTRIPAQDIGGVFINRRGTGLGSNQNQPSIRSRGFIDAAEAMIGNLLRNGDISGNALAEIEGTLGIRVVHEDSPFFRVDDASAENEGDPRTEIGRSNEQIGSTEIIGTLPHISQRTQPDIGYSAFTRSGQWAEISSMEFVYGGPSLTCRSRNYDIVTSLHFDSDTEMFNLTQLDLELFPSSPTVAASSRTHHALHPLLCGVDLPPVNSLVSDLLPHGIRARRHGQMITRQPGNWTNPAFSSGSYLVSTSSGNTIRVNRLNSGLSLRGDLPGRNTGVGLVGWTDDGLPIDAAVEEFRSILEVALSRLTHNHRLVHVPSSENTLFTSPQLDDETVDNENVTEVARMVEARDNERIENIDSHVDDRTISAEYLGIHRPSQSAMEDNLPENYGATVASSMVAELRISQDTEPTAEMPTQLSSERVEPFDPIANTLESQQALAVSSCNDLTCPPDIEQDFFDSIPREMQLECVDQYNATRELAAQLDGSSLDPEVLAALPEEVLREVIEQDRQERRLREQVESPADPTLAEEMDNASFIASLAPALREEVLRQADGALLSSLPPEMVAEAHILRARASARHGGSQETNMAGATTSRENSDAVVHPRQSGLDTAPKRKQRSGKIKVEQDRLEILYLPETLQSPICVTDLKTLIRLQYMLSPLREKADLLRVFHNFCINPKLRSVVTTTFVRLLHNDQTGAIAAIDSHLQDYKDSDHWRLYIDEFFSDRERFPPTTLIGAAPEFPMSEFYNTSVSVSLLRRKEGLGAAASMAANLPKSERSSAFTLPPIVASRIIETLLHLCKSLRFCLHVITCPLLNTEKDGSRATCFDQLIELLNMPLYTGSSGTLDLLLSLLESAISPLSHMAKLKDDVVEVTQRDLEAASTAGKEYVDVPRVEITQSRLKLICSVLRLETCRDAVFTKVNTIIRRLCRVDSNREYVLTELASVAHALGADALRDLKSLRIRMDKAAALHNFNHSPDTEEPRDDTQVIKNELDAAGTLSSSVTLSTCTSEVKFLRVLQALQALCNDNVEDHGVKKAEHSVIVSEELVHLLRQLNFDELWDELSSCLKVVQVLEGVQSFEEEEQKVSEDSQNFEDGDDDNAIEGNTKKLRNGAAGLLTRFLPSIEAFFVANGSAFRPDQQDSISFGVIGDTVTLDNLVGGQRMMEFATTNKVLLNALIRHTPTLLDKRLRALVQVARLRLLLDFDVKRQWFKAQVRRLRQQASRRHGSFRLQIRRKHVFADAFHQFQSRNADEMRGRLHVTFRDEAGVDAGGLSREFFGILAKEIFNPNYALFTSTEDGCTFQPNPHSAYNPDHLSYFRFVGRVVGKAVVDGYLLDAHFTRSLYKHMLGIEPTHHDMEAIDPDYYRNLKTILEYNLADIGLELSFSTEDHSFGRNQILDLIPGGRKIAVTEENKEEYVRKVCQHRMTTSIQSQIKAYLSGFYELVCPDLIAIFTPRELELLISGLPDIDLSDLKSNTDYVGWKANDEEINWFWSIMFSLSRNEKAAFLQFVTGSSKVPLEGFAGLQGMRGTQKFSIHKKGGSKGALMSAHTCFNSLDLPTYESEEEMREKLLLAINEGSGAFLFA